MAQNKDLRSFVRLDGQGRIVAGSNVLRTKMPRNGKWIEISVPGCCDPSTTTTMIPT